MIFRSSALPTVCLHVHVWAALIKMQDVSSERLYRLSRVKLLKGFHSSSETLFTRSLIKLKYWPAVTETCPLSRWSLPFPNLNGLQTSALNLPNGHACILILLSVFSLASWSWMFFNKQNYYYGYMPPPAIRLQFTSMFDKRRWVQLLVSWELSTYLSVDSSETHRLHQQTI